MQIEFIKTQNAQPIGQYAPTAIDAAKASADIRILDCGGTYTIDSKVTLSGRGIKPRAVPGRYEVTEAALTKLQAQFNVVCDF